MPRFAANLTFLYGEHAFLDRVAAAAADGFEAVECLFPYAFPPAELRARLRDQGLQLVLINAPPGEWDAGERGLACLPGREAAFRAAFEQALAYAHTVGCPRIHVLAGCPPDADAAHLQATYEANLAWAASQAATCGREVLIEPINHRDMPGYFLHRQAQAHHTVQQVGAANLKVQMDLYHCQVSEGDVATKLRQWLGDPAGQQRIGHLQIAGVPERQEPDGGELHHPYLFALLDELGYRGHVGCEYRPRAGTSAGLGWFQPYKHAQRSR